MVQFRRLTAFLIGCWLAGSIWMDATAIGNFHAVDRLLSAPDVPSADMIHQIGKANARKLLRRAAGESNIGLFEQSEWLQLALGLALLLVMVFGEKPQKLPILLCLAMISIVLADRIFLTPNIARLGRLVEFLPADPNLPDRRAFGMYHGISSSLELLKLGLGVAIAGILVFRRRDKEMFARGAEIPGSLAAGRPSR